MRLKKFDRQERILGKLDSDVTVRISTLAELFDVSTETIRRDIDALTEKGKVNRTYGGAASISLTSEPGISQRRQTNVPNRERVASLAALLVEAGDVLMIDSGSTTTHFARALTAYPKELTVLTNCLPVAQILGAVRDFRVIICPGNYDAGEKGIYGHETTAFLDRFHANKAFISAGGVTEGGVTDADAKACWIKRKMIEQSEQVLLLIDHDKADKPLFNLVCAWDDIDDVILDQTPSTAIVRSIEERQVRLHVAKARDGQLAASPPT